MAAKRMLAVLTICLVFGLGAVAGCAPQAPTPDATADAGAEASGEESQSGKDREYTEDELAVIAGAEGTTHGDIGEDVFLGKDYIDQLYDRWDMVAEEYSPRGPHAARRPHGAADAHRVRSGFRRVADAGEYEFLQHLLARLRQSGLWFLPC